MHPVRTADAPGDRDDATGTRQRERLLAQLARRRAALAAIEAAELQLHRRLLNEVEPLAAEVRESQRRLAELIDAVIEDLPRGGRAQRSEAALLRRWLRDLLDTQDDTADPPELADLRRRYDHPAPRERARRDHARLLACLEQVFAPDAVSLRRMAALDFDVLVDYAMLCVRHGQAHVARSWPWHSSDAPRATASGARRQAAPSGEDPAPAAVPEAAALRDIYRRLALALHPDREADPQARERKTELMQGLNQAYAARDLVTLLGLQQTFAPVAVAQGPTGRSLSHQITLLRKQLSELDACIAQRRDALRERLGLGPGRQSLQLAIDHWVARRRAELDAQLVELRADLEGLPRSRSRAARLARFRATRPEDPATAFDDFLARLQALSADRRRG